MTKFNQRRFSVSAPITDAYAENYERTFGKREPKPSEQHDVCAHQSSGACEACVLRLLDSRRNAAMACLPECVIHAGKIGIARIELEKWIARLAEVQPSRGDGRRSLDFVIESMKLILKADRITDALARK